MTVAGPSTARTAPPRETRKVLAELPRAAGLKVLVELVEWEGRRFLGIREYFSAADGWKPGKKGISIRLGELDAVAEALKTADVEAMRLGWTRTPE